MRHFSVFRAYVPVVWTHRVSEVLGTSDFCLFWGQTNDAYFALVAGNVGFCHSDDGRPHDQCYSDLRPADKSYGHFPVS